MFQKPNRRLTSIVVVTAFAVSACAGGATTTTMGEMGGSSMGSMDHGEMEFHFGEPAEAADADRVVEIQATNDLEFIPSSIIVSAGETITFRVTNTGSLVHDFFLGDEAAQMEHEMEMEEMRDSGQMMEHDEANAMSIAAQETMELTWHFTEAGSVIFGCHQKGHYEAGMHGTIDIS